MARAFLRESRRRLAREYFPKLRAVVGRLDTEAVWWRPNAHSNSIGNLLLHLDGNIHQWMLHGVGGADDRRDRAAEFAAHEGAGAKALLAQLGRTLREVDAVLAAIPPRELLTPRTIQGYRITVLQAVYHVVEHFSGHTGQILYIAKLQGDRALGLYPHLEGKRPRPGVRRSPYM